MNSNVITVKTTGLAKSGGVVRSLATRLERARLVRNEKISRADTEYVEAVRRAIEAVGSEQEETKGDDTPAVSPADVPEQAAS